MSLRHGVTAQEEHKLKTLISQGKSWEHIVALSQPKNEQGQDQIPFLLDVDLTVVKKAIFEPLVKKLEEAKKAGHKDIHSHEKKLAADKAKAKAVEKDE